MKNSNDSFSYSKIGEPHRFRTKEILKEHLEIRRHIGKNPHTIFVILGVVALQILTALFIKDQSWWLVLLAAYTIGAFANHSLFVMIHECAHNLIFKKRVANTFAGMLANLPQVVPSSVSFQKYHLRHHAYQGVYELDADLPAHWEARLIGSSSLRKALWLLLYPIVQAIRPLHLKGFGHVNRWILLNILVQFSFNATIWIFFGFKALMYLLISLFFSIGLHPLGARWIQRHYMIEDKQETYSYYGFLNRVALNVGYHNEHHDFPSVPWNKLPAVKKTAPEWYENLASHKSWTRLFFRFLFDRNLTLHSRTLREKSDIDGFTDVAYNPDREEPHASPKESSLN